jgi:hypothetical protein
MRWVAICEQIQHHDYCSEWVTIDHVYFDTEQEAKDWVEHKQANFGNDDMIFRHEQEHNGAAEDGKS